MNSTFDYVIGKYRIEVGHQYIISIPNIGREDIAGLFAELEFKVGAEIGVEKGLYSEVLCKANPGLHLYSIDSWSAVPYSSAAPESKLPQKWFDRYYEDAKKRLAQYSCTIVRKTSMSALDDFGNESLDFVYIDANHNFVNFTNDLHYWLKKVRSGGIISGHDYAIFSYRKHNHVKRVLDAYVRSYRMIPLFIAGAETYDVGLTRDRFRSWFWVKQ